MVSAEKSSTPLNYLYLSNKYSLTCNNYRLKGDVDLSNETETWHPIGQIVRGVGSSGTKDANFAFGYSGIFDGNGHSINGLNIYNSNSRAMEDFRPEFSNLSEHFLKYNILNEQIWNRFTWNSATTVDKSVGVYAGFFAKLDGATIRNLHFANPSIKMNYTDRNIGNEYSPCKEAHSIFAGVLAGSIESHTTNNTSGKTSITNVLVSNANLSITINGCAEQNLTTSSCASYIYVGGLIGYNYSNAKISNCVVKGGDIQACGTQNSYNTKAIRMFVGGMIGFNGSYQCGNYGATNIQKKFKLGLIRSYMADTNLTLNYFHFGKPASGGNAADQNYNSYLGGLIGGSEMGDVTIDSCFSVCKYGYCTNEVMRNTGGGNNDTIGSHPEKTYVQPILGDCVRYALDQYESVVNIINTYYYNGGGVTYRYADNIGVNYSGSGTRNLDWFSSTDCLNFLNG